MELGIVDEPLAPGKKDLLGISAYSDALSKFIETAPTPITIGVQGEWGSGKTSLINAIHHHFDDKANVKQIWINAWEYSLLSSPEESLLKIINKILDDILAADQDLKRGSKIKEGAGQIFKGALRVGASVTMGLEAGKVAQELLEGSDQNIANLRLQLGTLVEEIAHRNTNPISRVLVYVDDLDRIEPASAVALLELLKNIFNIPRCTFILAIDYQVVVKGLEAKFGKQTSENEWEFRAFFDKIIQLPFMMPMGDYDIGQYVNSLLVQVSFVAQGELKEDSIKSIILGTIGGNPRAIKRLVNSVSLIQIFSQTNNSGAEDQGAEVVTENKFLLFALLCVQIAYPHVYALLCREPNFLAWDDEFAFSDTQKREEADSEVFTRDFNIAAETSKCDEDWEQALFRMCYVRPRLKARFNDISDVLNLIKDEASSDSKQPLGELLGEVLSETSVTNVTSTTESMPARKHQSRTYFDGRKAWLLGKENFKLSASAVEKLEEILDYFESRVAETRYTPTNGASFFIEGRRIGSLDVRGASRPRFGVGLAKDFRRDYRVPNVPGFATGHARKFDIEKLGTHRYFSGFSLNCDCSDLDDDRIAVLRQLWDTNIELNSEYHDKLLPWRRLAKEVAEGQQETRDYVSTIMSEDYRYDWSP